jgi:hypothetical protein
MPDEPFPRGKLVEMCDEIAAMFSGDQDAGKVNRVVALITDDANEVDAANRAGVEEALLTVCAWWEKLKRDRKDYFADCYEYVVGILDAASLE